MADQPIDSLVIEIGASSSNAAGEIGKLAGELKQLKAAVKGNAPKLEGWAKQLKALADVAKDMGNSAIALSKVASAASKLQALKNVSIPENLPENLTKIGKAVAEIDDSSIDRLDRMTHALQRLANVRADNLKTFSNFKIPKAFTDSLAPKSLSESIGQGTSDAANNAQSKWKNATGKIIGFLAKLQAAEKNVGKGVDFSKMAEYNKAVRESNDKIAILRRQIQELQNQIPNASDAQKQDLEQKIAVLESGISKFIESKKQLQQAMRQDLGFTALATVLKTAGSAIKTIAKTALTAAKAIGGKFLSALKSAATAAANFTKSIVAAPFKRLAENIPNLKKRLDGLTSSFARIMFYRAIRTVIKEIGDAMKYGEENAYWFSKKFGEATRYISEAYDAYASATEMMKNQVGAAWATLFANIQPIIEAITDLVAKAAEVVTQFFASLGGKTSYLKATKYAKDWKDETEEATKAAKEWKNQLMGFDEINRLEEQSDGSSGKIKDNTPDYAQMFEEVAVDSEISDLANKMKDLWNKQDWKGLGELIGNTLNDLFPSRETWEKWGKQLGTYINGAIQTAYYALKTIKFNEWGSRIASGFNKALNEIDTGVWGRLIVRKVTAAFDFLIGFLGDLDFHQLGLKIGNFFRGAFDEATEWLMQYEWGDMGGKLWEKIKSLVDGFDIPTFASSLGNFIVTAANSAADFLNGIDFTDVVDYTIESLKKFFDNLPQDEIKSAISNLWEAIKKAFKDSMGEIGKWLKGKNDEGYFHQLGVDFNTGLTNLLNDAETLFDAVPWGEIGTAISDFLKGLHWFDIMKEVFGFVGEKTVEAVQWVFSPDGKTVRDIGAAVLGIKLAFTGSEALLSLAARALVLKILNPFGKLAPGISAAGAAAGTTLAEKMSPLAGTASGALGKLTTAVKTGAANATAAITTGMSNFTVAGNTLLTGAAATFANAALGVTDAILIAYDYEKLKEVGDTYASQQQAINNEVDLKMSSFKEIYEKSGRDVADEWAKIVTGVDTHGMELDRAIAEIASATRAQYEDVPKNMWEGFKAGWKEHFESGGSVESLIGNGFKGIIDWGKQKLGIGQSGDKSQEFENIAKSSVGGLEKGFAAEMPNATKEWSEHVKELPKGVQAALGFAEGSDTSTEFENIGRNSAKGLQEGWNEEVQGMVDEWVADINELPKGVRNALGIESPSTVFHEIGVYTVAGLLEGLQEKWHDVESFFTESIPQIAESVKSSWGEIKESTAETWGNVLNTAKSAWDKMLISAKSTTQNITKSFLSAWTSIPDGLQDVLGKVKTWWSGNVAQYFTAQFWKDKVDNALRGFGAVIHNNLVRGLAEVIPQLREKFQDVGKSLIDGIKNGFTSKWSDFSMTITNKITELANLIAEKFSSVIQSMHERMNATADSIRSTWETLRTGTQNAINQAAEAVNSFISKAKSALHISGYASGGFPTTGEFYIAREAGPELVGRIGNKNAVANNDQIVAAVASGVANANEDVVNAIYTVGAQLINAVADSASRNGGQPDWRSISRMITEQQTRRATAVGA